MFKFLVCGQKRPKGTANVIGGRNATKGDYPWQIGVYRSSTKQHICGGAVINQRVVVSGECNLILTYFRRTLTSYNFKQIKII